jgi:hypothetical protein
MTSMSKPNPGRTPGSIEALYTDSSPKISRRRFAAKAAAMAAAPFSIPSPLLGANGTPARPGAGESEPGDNLDLTSDQVREADARLANAIRQFGGRLSEEQRGRLRRILLYNEKMLASIRAFHVENGDPPASVLCCSDDGIDAPERPRPHSSPGPSRGVEKQD